MSKLKELIKELCPDGVEYKKLWELTAWDKNFISVEKEKQNKVLKYNYILAAELKSYESSSGTVKILTTSITDLWANEEDVKDLLSEAEIVCIPWGGNPIVQYYKGKFITGDNRIATSLDKSILNNKFLYYCMINKLPEISSFYRGSGIKHPDMSKVLELEIPLPPIEVQQEIVRILDKFSGLTAELQELLNAELTARRKQYAYYRDKLLTFDESVKMVTLNNCCEFIKDGTHSSFKDVDDGYPLLSAKDVYDGIVHIPDNCRKISRADYETIYKTYKLKKGDVLLTIVGTIGRTAVLKEDLQVAFQRSVGILRPSEKINSSFLKYSLTTQYAANELMKNTNQSAQGGVYLGKLSGIRIPLPPLAEQERIVSILDRFDTLCNDISQGIPAEIAARKKQYEYYRDKLLTFTRKN